jgi:hypothetical protein
MKISHLSRVHAKTSTPVDVPDLLAWLKENGSLEQKEHAPLWSPIAYKDGSRKGADAVEVSCLVFDFDHGRPETVFARLKLKHAWHTTHSHTPESPKWRLLVFLDKPVAAKSWSAFYQKAAELLGLTTYDESCFDLAQFFYVPPVTAIWECFEGEPLSVAGVESYKLTDNKALKSVLLKASNPDYQEPIRRALSGKPLARPGGRDNTVTGLGYYLGRFVVPAEMSINAVLALMKPGFALEGDEPASHWEAKFSAAFGRGREARQARTEETTPKGEWTSLLQKVSRADGSVQVMSNSFNASVILRHEGTWAFRSNALESCCELWADGDWRRLTDADCTHIANWLQEKYHVNQSRQQVFDQIEAIAAPYDPLVSYLDSLNWDGSERLDSFLVRYFGCEDTPATRLYSRKWLIGLVSRAMKPGCKMDTVLVLQGKQGFGKSTALKLLTDPWFSDSKVTIGEKDSLLGASRFWCHEFAELASLKRTDLETMKSFFTSTEDAFRPPYGRATVVRPRRCVYVATTNEDEFLNDMTGARRFWVCRVVRPISFDLIKRDRGQIFAEAMKAYRSGESYWLETDADRAIQEKDAEEYRIEEFTTIQDEITKWWGVRPFDKRPEHLTSAMVVRDVLGVPIDRANRVIEMAAARALRELGFVHTRITDNGRRRWGWSPPATFLKMPQRTGDGKVVDFKKETGT